MRIGKTYDPDKKKRDRAINLLSCHCSFICPNNRNFIVLTRIGARKCNNKFPCNNPPVDCSGVPQRIMDRFSNIILK